VLIVDGIILIIAIPREQIGGSESVVVLETNDSYVNRRVKRKRECLATFAISYSNAREDGLFVASHITVIAGGKG
jgi:hypothetical protein